MCRPRRNGITVEECASVPERRSVWTGQGAPGQGRAPQGGEGVAGRRIIRAESLRSAVWALRACARVSSGNAEGIRASQRRGGSSARERHARSRRAPGRRRAQSRARQAARLWYRRCPVAALPSERGTCKASAERPRTGFSRARPDLMDTTAARMRPSARKRPMRRHRFSPAFRQEITKLVLAHKPLLSKPIARSRQRVRAQRTPASHSCAKLI